MSSGPTLTCESCGHAISTNTGHNITDHGRLICSRCLNRRNLHSDRWPDCPHTWHDNYDHIRHVIGTRAAAAHLLGGEQ